LSKYNLPATFFIPGQTADTHPDVVRAIADAGHEIGHHTYSHKLTYTLKPEEEQADFLKGIEALERVVGKKPRGYRAPGMGLFDVTKELLIKHGFEYDVSELGADRPYWMEYKGKRTNVVELTFAIELVDTPYLLFTFPPYYMTGNRAPSKIEEIWRGDFDGAFKEGGDSYYGLITHPYLIGRLHAMRMLERVLVYILEHDGVWFAQMGEIANEFRKREGSA
jgi:peptidoglycan/xylan/chitin deacetylase (PgdA/CDA1 family)